VRPLEPAPAFTTYTFVFKLSIYNTKVKSLHNRLYCCLILYSLNTSSCRRISACLMSVYRAGDVSLATLLFFATGAPYLTGPPHEYVSVFRVLFEDSNEKIPRARTSLNELVLPVCHTTYRSFRDSMLQTLLDFWAGSE